MANFTGVIPAGTVNDNDIGASAGIQRSKLAAETKKYNILLNDLRIWNSASNAVLPQTASSDDLAFVLGTFGTDGHRVETEDAQSATVQQYARGQLILPPEYVSGGTLQIAAFAGLQTTVSDGTATVDFDVRKKSKTTFLHGSDLVTTGATDINSLTLDEKAFTITPTGLEPGDELDFRVVIDITDSATGTPILGTITAIYLLAKVKG